MRIFYSWQSDLPAKYNRNAIRGALRKAKLTLESSGAASSIELDEATSRTSGSPNISLKIIEKIQNADVFIGDITTVISKRGYRPCPNPNVTFELGYAVAELGWDRIILMFNKEFGKFPNDVPFDFAQHRAMLFRLDDKASAAEKTVLAKTLQQAISAIISDSPKRPSELRGLSIEQVQHDRDVKTISRLLAQIHFPSVDQFITEMPHCLDEKAIFFWEGICATYENSLFHLNDLRLAGAANDFVKGFHQALSYDYEYHDTPNPNRHIFSSPGDSPLDAKRQLHWDAIEAGIKLMEKGKIALLKRLREAYHEVDIDALNGDAWKEYIEHRKQYDYSD